MDSNIISPGSGDLSRNPSPRTRVRHWLNAQPDHLKDPYTPKTPSPLRHELILSESAEPDDENLGSDTLKVPKEVRRGNQEHFDHVMLTSQQLFEDYQREQMSALRADQADLDQLRNSVTGQFKQLDQFQYRSQNIDQLYSRFYEWDKRYIENMETLSEIRGKSISERNSLENKIRSTQGDTSKSFNKRVKLIKELRDKQALAMGTFFYSLNKTIETSKDRLRHIKLTLDGLGVPR